MRRDGIQLDFEQHCGLHKSADFDERGSGAYCTKEFSMGTLNIFAEGLKRFRVPVMGLIEFEYSSFYVGGEPDLRFTVYAPRPGDSARKARRLFSLAPKRGRQLSVR